MSNKWIGAIASVLLLVPMAARADIIDGSFSGTITGAFDYGGVFGPANTDLSNDALTGTFSYNTALLSTAISGGQNTATGTGLGAVTVTITIAGNSYTFTDQTSSSVYLDDGSSDGLSEFTLQNVNNSDSFYLDISEANSNKQFVFGTSLTEPLNIVPDGNTSVISDFMIANSGSGASGGFTITSLTSSDISSSVPEPAGMAVLAMGLIGLAGARARKARAG